MRNKRRGFWLGVLLGLVTVGVYGAGSAAAADYYVNGTNPLASDSNPGTASLPWKTIQNAANTMVAGDRVSVSAGTYDERVTSSRSGVAGNPITFRTAGTVVMRGFTLNHSYLTVDGFEITSTGQSSSISVSGSYCQLLNNNIHDSGPSTSTEINLMSGSANCTVKGNHIWGSQAYGDDHPCVMLRGTNHRATDNEIGPILDADAFRPFGSGQVMSNNYIHDITLSPGSVAHPDIFQTYGDSGDSAYNIVFENNLIMNTASQMFMTSVDGQNIHDFDVRNNVYVNVTQPGNIGVPNFRFYNNVLYNVDSLSGVCLVLFNKTWGVANNASIKNNLFIGGSGHSFSEPYTFQDNNDNSYSTPAAAGLTGVETDYNYAAGNPATGYPPLGGFSEPHGINGGDPEFLNPGASDFHLRPGSPAIDKAVVVAGFNYDKDGVTRPQGAAWDIGAYEFVANNSNPPIILSSPRWSPPASFQFIYTATPGSNYAVRRSGLLPAFNLIATNMATSSLMTFADTNATGAFNAYSVKLLLNP